MYGKRGKLGNRGINIDSENINHRRFTDDIILIANIIQEAQNKP